MRGGTAHAVCYIPYPRHLRTEYYSTLHTNALRNRLTATRQLATTRAATQHNMQTVLSIAGLIAFAAASPLPSPEHSEALPLVTLSLIGSPSHYTLGSSQNPQTSTSTSNNAWSIHIPIDVSLDLSTRPEHVQAIEILGVEKGTDLRGGAVERDDAEVVCKASLGWGSEGVFVRMGGERVLLDGGKVGRVTGVECWKERV